MLRQAMPFQGWLRLARVTDDPAGDFIMDALGDDELQTKHFRSFDDLEGYLADQDACFDAVQAARVVWRRYKTWQRR